MAVRGFLLLDPHTEEKYGQYFTYQQEFLELVGFTEEQLKDGNPIAQCEAAAVVMMMLACSETLTGRDVLLFIDNTSAMHSFVKGISKNVSLARSVFCGQLIAY